MQRSKDGKQWENVSSAIQLSYQGGKIAYSMEDKQPYTGESFYRVKAMAQSGDVSYSRVKAVRIGNNKELKVYPNPFTDLLSVPGMDHTEKIHLTDLSGRLVPVRYVAGSGIYLHELKAGIYFLHIGTKTMKVQKL